MMIILSTLTYHCCWFITWYTWYDMIWHFFLPSGTQPWLENPPFSSIIFPIQRSIYNNRFPQDCHICFPRLSHEHLDFPVIFPIFSWFSHDFLHFSVGSQLRPLGASGLPVARRGSWLGPRAKNGNMGGFFKRWKLEIFDDFWRNIALLTIINHH